MLFASYNRCRWRGCWWCTMTWTWRAAWCGCVPRAAMAATTACAPLPPTSPGLRTFPASASVRPSNLLHSLALSPFDLSVHIKTEPGCYCCCMRTPHVPPPLLNSSTPFSITGLLLVEGSHVHTRVLGLMYTLLPTSLHSAVKDQFLCSHSGNFWLSACLCPAILPVELVSSKAAKGSTPFMSGVSPLMRLPCRCCRPSATLPVVGQLM